MIGAIVLFALLVALSVVFIFFPAVSPGARGGRAGDRREDDRRMDDRRVALERQKLQILHLIKDLEFDQRTGKLSAADYEHSRAEAEREAIGVLKELDALGAQHGWTDDALEAEIRRVRERLARESA